ncbi:MAG: nicotinic acid mononucleotide adenylyltransferase, partial [Pseudomonadota bacterium]
LKAEGPAPMARRLATAKLLVTDPRIVVTDLEMCIGTRFTAQTLENLQSIYPGVAFSWIMGADNLAGFHRWERWPSIVARVPIGVLARPGVPIWTRTARAARLYRDARIKPAQSHLLARAVPPAWCYLPMPMQDVSSTEIRDRGAWRR